MNQERYGEQVHIALLASATIALIGGFALFSQGLYETIGRDWYQVANQRRTPIHADLGDLIRTEGFCRRSWSPRFKSSFAS